MQRQQGHPRSRGQGPGEEQGTLGSANLELRQGTGQGWGRQTSHCLPSVLPQSPPTPSWLCSTRFPRSCHWCATADQEKGNEEAQGTRAAGSAGLLEPGATRHASLTQMSCFSPMGKLEYRSTISGVLYMGVVFLVI